MSARSAIFGVDLDQAINYDKKLRSGTLESASSSEVEGLIYFVEDPKHAASINQKLANNCLHPDILAATFDSGTGQVRFLKRPPAAGKPPPVPVEKGKAKK